MVGGVTHAPGGGGRRNRRPGCGPSRSRHGAYRRTGPGRHAPGGLRPVGREGDDGTGRWCATRLGPGFLPRGEAARPGACGGARIGKRRRPHRPRGRPRVPGGGRRPASHAGRPGDGGSGAPVGVGGGGTARNPLPAGRAASRGRAAGDQGHAARSQRRDGGAGAPGSRGGGPARGPSGARGVRGPRR